MNPMNPSGQFGKIKYNPELIEYLELNGYERKENKYLCDGLLFINDKKAVHIWNNRIQSHVKSKRGDVYRLKCSFEGLNPLAPIDYFIMLLHIMDVINIQEAVALGNQQSKQVDHVHDLINSKPIVSTCQR